MQNALMRRREMTMAQIVNQERFCRTKARTARLEALQARLLLARRYHQDFQDVELEIFTRCADQQSQMNEFEEVFCYVVAELNFCINIRTAEVDTQTLRVAKEDFPRFNGKYNKWKQFEFIYTIVIHNNKTLSNKTKFELLIELLTTEPRSLIDGIILSDANYNDAWLQIKSHYNSPTLMINKIVKNLLAQPCVRSGDADKLKQLLEVTEVAIRNLNSLGSGAQSRDPWLIGILLQKLDVFTQNLWVSELKHLDSPTFSDLMRFLNVRLQMLMGYRYVCKVTGISNVSNLDDNCQRRVLPSIVVTQEQESCPGTESECKPSLETTFKDYPSSSPTKDQKPHSRPAATASEEVQGNCQLNGKQATDFHGFENPLNAVVATARSTGAIKKVIGKTAGSVEFLV